MYNTLKKEKNRIVTSLFVFILSLFLITVPLLEVISANEVSEEDDTNNQLREIIAGIISWKKASLGVDIEEPLLNDTFLANAGDTNVDWYPIGIGRIGYPDEYDSYLAVIKDVIEKRYKHRNKLSKAKATEWHRISLAILASGGDPTSFGQDENGQIINLIADGTYDRGKTRSLGAQGLNGWIWGLITLDSLRYIVPDDAHSTRENMIEEILSAQLEDGGFSLSIEPNTNLDITAMAIQALAPYYNSEETYTYEQSWMKKKVTKTVREVIDVALHNISEHQLEDGDFETWGTSNAESTAQVIVALTSLGIDPLKDERFIKNGNTLLDGLLKYRMEDGGFIHSESFDPENPTSLPDESNTMASEQALYSLTSLLRLHEGYRSLYDFREEMDA